MRDKWFRFRFDDSRWWATTILVAVAVWATPMSPIVHKLVACVAWVLAITFFAVSIMWDYFRWHWPFLPLGIQRQIENGEQIKRSLAIDQVSDWRATTLDLIRKCWSFESEQYRKFEALPELPNRLMELDMLLSMLKGLDPR
jgi:hypothetical protein